MSEIDEMADRVTLFKYPQSPIRVKSTRADPVQVPGKVIRH